MKRTNILGSIFFVLLVSQAAVSMAAPGTPGSDWPQWAGPSFDLTVQGAGIFDRAGFGLARDWVRPLGSAYSGIVVAGNLVITGSSDGTSDFFLALDATTGEEVWRYQIGKMYQGHDGSDDGPNGTPLVYGGRVYGLGPSGHLFALRLEDGKAVFAHKVDELYGAAAPAHGFTTAPTLVDGVLVVQTGGAGGHSISGFDPDSGKLLWQTGDDKVEYQSPMALEVGGSTLVLAITSENILGLGPQKGELLFRFAYRELTSYAASQPVPLGKGKFLLAGRRGSGLYQVAKREAGGYDITEIWATRSLRGSYTIPVPHEGHIYGYSGSFLTCVDAATGETLWKSRPPGPGTLVLVDGHLFILAKSGDLVVAKASPAGFVETTRIKALDEGSLTAPSFAGKRFFVRSLAQIAALGVTEQVAAGAEAPKPEIELYGQFAQFIAQVEGEASVEAKKKRITELLEAQKSFPIIEDNRWVHFVFQGKVDDLALAGNFYADENERPMGRIEGTDFYYRSVVVEPAAHYTYQFQVFGEPKLDPRNPRQVEGQNAPASELVMPGWPEPKHIAEPSGPRGRLETLTWASEKLGRVRDVQVYLPAGYDMSGERYELLVVNDGDEALRFGRMANSLDNLIGDTVTPIVVAFVPNVIFHEYVSVAGQRDLAEAMVSELLPKLAAKYRLLEEPGSHGIMGTTFGASHAVHAALRHPEVFGHVAVQSYFAYQSEGEVAAMLGQGRGKGLRVYVELNTNDTHFATWADAEVESRRLVKRLREGGAEVIQHEVADGPDWSSWRSRTNIILAALFPKSQVSGTSEAKAKGDR